MTIVVPFDGSELAESALVRAISLAEAFDEEVRAFTIIPDGSTEYARDHGWVGPDEEFDLETVVGQLRKQVETIAPDADFEFETVQKYASTGTISTELRRSAKAADASILVIGSDNAGHMVTSIHSVGTTVAADDAFDVLIVRRPIPADSPPPVGSGW